jgi:hypothetical protein
MAVPVAVETGSSPQMHFTPRRAPVMAKSYYEGNEFETSLKENQPGDLSPETSGSCAGHFDMVIVTCMLGR